MSKGEVRYTVHYSRPSRFDDDRPCRVYCEEAEADQCVIEVRQHGGEMRFHRRDDGSWPFEKRMIERWLQDAFDQGDAFARKDIRDGLRELLAV